MGALFSRRAFTSASSAFVRLTPSNFVASPSRPMSESTTGNTSGAPAQVEVDLPAYPVPVQEREEEVKAGLEDVRKRLEAAASQGGKTKPRLVAVSKFKPPSDIMAAYKAGQRHFGENYVNELVDKAPVLPPDVRWHFVGALQSNKGKALASIPNLYLLETLTSVKAADILEKARASVISSLSSSSNPVDPLGVYIQINTSGEDQKAGLTTLREGSTETSNAEAEVVRLAAHILNKCPHLRLQGLMTIGSFDNSASAADAAENPDFQALLTTRRALLAALMAPSSPLSPAVRQKLIETRDQDPDGGGLPLELSMGMSADFEIAAKMGSGNVRVGTSIFGQRGGREEAKEAREREAAKAMGDQNWRKSSQ